MNLLQWVNHPWTTNYAGDMDSENIYILEFVPQNFRNPKSDKDRNVSISDNEPLAGLYTFPS
jgi:hypothetical protein